MKNITFLNDIINNKEYNKIKDIILKNNNLYNFLYSMRLDNLWNIAEYEIKNLAIYNSNCLYNNIEYEYKYNRWYITIKLKEYTSYSVIELLDNTIEDIKKHSVQDEDFWLKKIAEYKQKDDIIACIDDIIKDMEKIYIDIFTCLYVEDVGYDELVDEFVASFEGDDNVFIFNDDKKCTIYQKSEYTKIF